MKIEFICVARKKRLIFLFKQIHGSVVWNDINIEFDLMVAAAAAVTTTITKRNQLHNLDRMYITRSLRHFSCDSIAVVELNKELICEIDWIKSFHAVKNLFPITYLFIDSIWKNLHNNFTYCNEQRSRTVISMDDNIFVSINVHIYKSSYRNNMTIKRNIQHY